MKRSTTVIVFLIILISATAHAVRVGDTGRATWEGTEYDVKVRKVSHDGKKCFITWPGYDSSWDEWRACSEITFDQKEAAYDEPLKTPKSKYLVGRIVEVMWKDKWHSAKIISVNPDLGIYKVHYTGKDNSWDEWVKPNRIK